MSDHSDPNYNALFGDSRNSKFSLNFSKSATKLRPNNEPTSKKSSKFSILNYIISEIINICRMFLLTYLKLSGRTLTPTVRLLFSPSQTVCSSKPVASCLPLGVSTWTGLKHSGVACERTWSLKNLFNGVRAFPFCLELPIPRGVQKCVTGVFSDAAEPFTPDFNGVFMGSFALDESPEFSLCNVLDDLDLVMGLPKPLAREFMTLSKVFTRSSNQFDSFAGLKGFLDSPLLFSSRWLPWMLWNCFLLRYAGSWLTNESSGKKNHSGICKHWKNAAKQKHKTQEENAKKNIRRVRMLIEVGKMKLDRRKTHDFSAGRFSLSEGKGELENMAFQDPWILGCDVPRSDIWTTVPESL